MQQRTKNVFAGALFLGVGAVFLVWSLLTLHMGTASQMGPGYFPAALGALLCLLGVGVITSAQRQMALAEDAEADERGPVRWRPILMIVLSPLAFALTIEPLGLLPASFLTLIISVFASSSVSIGRGLVVTLGFTAFCALVFKYGLGVPFHLAWF
ncbi:tripartite tricarboxylate transporter TctB family protein [Pseudochelatococcus sp. B33]